MKPNNSMTVKIDLTRCHGHARCMEEAPKTFGYTDDTNQAYVLQNADQEASRTAIDRAIAACPERAISWVEKK